MSVKMKCIIVDDEQFAIDSLLNYCRKVAYIEVVATFNDSYKAYSYLEFNTPDLIFLDIQMPDISGIQIAKFIKNRAMIIFTTAHVQYAINGFNLNAVDYLLKPLGFERFNEAVKKAKDKFNTKNINNRYIKGERLFLTVKVEYMNVYIEVSNILYIEAMDNYSRIFTTKKTITTLMSLKSILALLPGNEFIRVHKSFIISRSKLIYFTKEYVVIADKSIPVGRVYSKNLMPLLKLER